MESKPLTNDFGNTYWKLPDGTTHREDGPAIIYASGAENWIINGKLHRLVGPAVIDPNIGFKAWWINGYHITPHIKKWAKDLNIDLDNLSEEDKIMIRLYWENYNGN